MSEPNHPPPAAPQNPYAPPAGDGDLPMAAEPQDRQSRGLRIAGAVVLILVGLWSAGSGGCSLVASKFASEAEGLGGAISDTGVDGHKAAKQLLGHLAGYARGLAIAGTVTLLAGVLCLTAAVLFFFERGRWLGLAAASAGVIGEVLFFTLVAFNAFGLVKLAVYGFCAFCALQVGQAR